MKAGSMVFLLLFAVAHLLLSTTVLAMMAVDSAEGSLGNDVAGSGASVRTDFRLQELGRLLLTPLVWCSFGDSVCAGVQAIFPGAIGALRLPANSLFWTTLLAAVIRLVAWFGRAAQI